ncbi:MAG: ABC transporter permease [Pseudomonadota bacterium]
MKLGDLLAICLRMVIRNRRRYNAVIAAIAFGTAGFIVIQTMGDSVEKKINENLELLGEATIMKAHWEDDESAHPGQYYMRDVIRLQRLDNVVAAAPMVSLGALMAYSGSKSWSPGLLGVDHSFWCTQSAKLKTGRLIGPSDVVGRRQVCVLGADVVAYLFPNEEPVGKSISVANLSFKVIGTLQGIQHTDVKRAVIVPITTAQGLFSGLDRIKEIYLRVSDWTQVDSVRDAALSMLSQAHQGYDEGVRVLHYPERVRRVKATVTIVKLFVYAALIMTFALGKVGLTSIMLAAVQERTREIGLKKALGARERFIMAQFLTESVLISLLAGTGGVIIGFASVIILQRTLDVEVSAYLLGLSVLIDLVVTMTIGVISGMYPSLKASRLDPMTAMRFE